MKKTKKLVSFLLILGTLGVSYVSANDESRKVAENYIKEMENFGPFWKGKKPTIVKETPFYTYDDKNVSYMEYKVSCNDDVDCGFIMVNTDKSDVSVPMASLAGKTLSEQMDENNSGKNKNYYFDVFNHFAITNTGNVKTTSPENKALDNGENIYTRSIDKNPLYEKFKEIKKNAEYNRGLKIIQNRKYLFRSAVSGNQNGTEYGLISDKILDKDNCKSMVPCYEQTEYNYPWSRVKPGFYDNKGPVGCVPTAIAMIYGFYDRNGFDIISGTAPIVSTKYNWDDRIKNLQERLGEILGVTLGHRGGGTHGNIEGFKILDEKNIKYKWDFVSYNYNPESFKREIKEGRPIYQTITTKYETDIPGATGTIKGEEGGHAIVIYGYYGKNLLANFGWGNIAGAVVLNVNGNYYDTKIGAATIKGKLEQGIKLQLIK